MPPSTQSKLPCLILWTLLPGYFFLSKVNSQLWCFVLTNIGCIKKKSFNSLTIKTFPRISPLPLILPFILVTTSCRPVIMQLFSEMTVLGFLSILTFVFCYGGTLDTWSADIFGESGEDYIEDMLETIHYLLFLIMVLTITEVFLLIYIGNLAVKNFYRYNVIGKEYSMFSLSTPPLDCTCPSFRA